MALSLGPLDRLLPKGGMRRQVATVAVGTGAGQAAVVLASPVLSRLYTPDDFGLFATYLALLSLAAVIVSLRYPLAVVLPHDDDDAQAIVVWSCIVTVGASLALGLGAWLLGDALLYRLKANGLAPFLWLVPAGALLGGTTEAFSYLAVRRRRFGLIASAKGSSGVTKASVSIALGLESSFGVLGLVLGDIASRSLALILLIRHANLRYSEAVRRRISVVARRFWRFAIFATPGAFLNSAGLQAAPLLLAGFYGMEVAGWFGLGQRVVVIPLAFLGKAVAQVYVGEAGRLSREDPRALRHLFTSTTIRLLVIGAIPIGLLAIGGPRLFELIFGTGWGETGTYLRLTAVMYLVQFAVSPLSQTLNVLENQHWQFAWDALRFVMVAASIGIPAIAGYGPRMSLVAYAVSMAACYALLLILNWLALTRLIESKGSDD